MIRSMDIPRPAVAKMIDTQVEILVQTLNLGMTLNEFQKMDLVQSIMEQYPNEGLYDFMLCFKMAKNGLLGPIYNRIDRQVIHQWMQKYLELKSIELEAARLSGDNAPIIEDPRKLSDEEKQARKDDYVRRVNAGLALRKKLEDLDRKSSDDKIQKLKNEDGYQSFRSDYLSKSKTGDAGGGVAGNDNSSANPNLSIPNRGAGKKSNGVRGDRQKPSK